MILTDRFNRVIRYLRVSVTDRCNFNCNYCRIQNEEIVPNNQNLLTFDETTRLCRIFASMGVERFRLTGGEPLVRRNVVSLVEQLAKLPGVQELSLSSNALLLGRFAPALKKAGLHRVNISLDSLNPDTFKEITQGGELKTVIQGIEAALKVGLHPVKVNMVVMRGINDHEIAPMVTFAKERGVVLRFIETMPVGRAGKGVSDRFVSAEEILGIIKTHFGTQLIDVNQKRGSGPARYFRLFDTQTEVGVISARSQHFCDGCNRMRLTSKGELVYCLGGKDQMDLKTPMRNGATDDDIHSLILHAVSLKPEKHQFDQVANLDQKTHDMSSLGG